MINKKAIIFLHIFFLAIILISQQLLAFENDQATIALWRMGQSIQLPNGQPAIADDDTGTNTHTPRNAYLRFGNSSQWAGISPEIVNLGVNNKPVLYFDGVDDVSVALAVWVGDQFKFDSVQIETSFCAYDIPQNGYKIIAGATAWEIWLTNFGVCFVTWGDDQEYNPVVSVVSNNIVAGQWNTLTAQYSGGIATLTLNDISYSATQDSLQLISSGLYLGGRPGTAGKYFNGLIGDTKISVPDMPSQYPSTQPAEDGFNTVMLWNFDEPILDGVIRDFNVNNHRRRAFNGTLIGNATIAEGLSSEFGNCLYLDGVNSEAVFAPDGAIDESDFRISGRVKLDASVQGVEDGKRYVIAAQPSKFQSGYRFENGQWLYYTAFFWDGGSKTIFADIDPYQWHQVAFQWYRGVMSLYVDGVLKDRASTRASESLKALDGNITLGANGSGGNRFKGYIDDFHITTATTTQSPCGSRCFRAADVNMDCCVNAYDLFEIAENWLSSTQNQFTINADLNHDGEVNLLDYAIIADQWLWN